MRRPCPLRCSFILISDILTFKINNYNALKRLFNSRALDVDENRKNIPSVSRKSEGIGYREADFDETDYYFENGLRKVYPYPYTFVAACKQRWCGKSILDVYSELGDLPTQQYIRRIEKGYVTVNGDKVGIDYKLEHMDVLSSDVHRHEMPVLASHIKVIGECDDLIAIEKPPSIPVHPCGYYRHNSVLFILAKELKLRGLYGIHRLDRLTSGVLLFARTKEKARQIQEEIQQKTVQKTYIAKVEGNFPDETVHCEACLKEINGKVGLSLAGKKGKNCLTEFHKIRYDRGSSIVMCKPQTGRMHQIRAHLQYLGYPIINDYLYNSYAFGLQKGKDGYYGRPLQDILEDINKIKQKRGYECSHDETCSFKSNLRQIEKYRFLLSDTYETDVISSKYIKDEKRITHDDECWKCNIGMREPIISDLYICLHALEYEGKNWKFKSEMPAWASKAWVQN